MRARTLLLFLILVSSLTITPIAAAQTPSDDAYNRESLGVIGEIETEEPTPPSTTEVTPQPPTNTPPAETPQGELPFTGFEVGVVAAAGILLLGSGLLLRRRMGGHGAEA